LQQKEERKEHRTQNPDVGSLRCRNAEYRSLVALAVGMQNTDRSLHSLSDIGCLTSEL